MVFSVRSARLAVFDGRCLMSISITHTFNADVATLWSIVGQPDRVDWVPGAELIRFEDNIRHFKLPGAGQVAEKILELDEENTRIRYSVIESPAPLAAHEACITLMPHANGVEMQWTTQVEPSAVEPFIKESKHVAIKRLEEMLNV